jgi:hypothetical protein
MIYWLGSIRNQNAEQFSANLMTPFLTFFESSKIDSSRKRSKHMKNAE